MARRKKVSMTSSRLRRADFATSVRVCSLRSFGYAKTYVTRTVENMVTLTMTVSRFRVLSSSPNIQTSHPMGRVVLQHVVLTLSPLTPFNIQRPYHYHDFGPCTPVHRWLTTVVPRELQLPRGSLCTERSISRSALYQQRWFTFWTSQ